MGLHHVAKINIVPIVGNVAAADTAADVVSLSTHDGLKGLGESQFQWRTCRGCGADSTPRHRALPRSAGDDVASDLSVAVTGCPVAQAPTSRHLDPCQLRHAPKPPGHTCTPLWTVRHNACLLTIY